MDQVLAKVASFDATGLLEKFKDILLVEKVINRLQEYWGLIPQGVFEFCAKYERYMLIFAVCLLALLAFEGHKIFKMLLFVGIPTGCAIVGMKYIAPWLAPYILGAVPGFPEFANLDALIGVALALVGLFIARCAYNFIVMFLGGAFGFLFGYMYVWRVLRNFFSSLDFLNTDGARLIIAGICAAVFVLFFILLFKHVLIAVSSFGCMAGSAIFLQKLVCPGADDQMKWCFVLVGCAVAVFAIVHQYKEEEKSFEILF
jgi:hypothetical protein